MTNITVSSIFSKIVYLTCVSVLLIGCKKEWLEAKPEKALVVPSTIADYQAMLDNNYSFGSNGFNDGDNTLDEVASGDLFVTDDIFNISTAIERNMYTWAADIYAGDANYTEWSVPYNRILNCNIILEGIEKIQPGSINEQTAWNQVKGSALFFRAYNHYSVAKDYCGPFVMGGINDGLGIPLKLRSDIFVNSVRSSVKETYASILGDLDLAFALLPVDAPDNIIYKMRPTKAAVYALKARIYLAMRDYDLAFEDADKCLQLTGSLMDYATELLPLPNYPIPQLNKEIILYMKANSWAMLSINYMSIDTALFNSYADGDLRKTLFYGPNNGFLGSYDASSYPFSGLCTDEMYLIRAECFARKGLVTEAMNDLNTLMSNRWSNMVPFQAIVATDKEEAITKILNERRKELLIRGIRWTDLRRLNQEPGREIHLSRTVNGQTFSLAPNDPKYILPIPTTVIQLTGMPQNPR